MILMDISPVYYEYENKELVFVIKLRTDFYCNWQFDADILSPILTSTQPLTPTNTGLTWASLCLAPQVGISQQFQLLSFMNSTHFIMPTSILKQEG